MDLGRNISDVAKRLDAAVVALGHELSHVGADSKHPYAASTDEADSLAVVVEELKARFADLQALNRDLEDFIGTIAHDLRSPLRSVVGTSQILIEDFGSGLPDDAKDLLRRQVEAGKRMSSLIDDLVDYTRLGQGIQERFDFDLTLMAQDVSYELAEQTWPNPVSFQIEPGMRISGYPGLVRIVLQSLLENAVKFATSVRSAKIELGCIVGPRERIYYVRDNGPGFSQDDAAQIFEPFVRMSDPLLAGNGIGLANTRKAILKHCGRVWAESVPGLGATFFFTLG
jgi:signal transduction histidine kinase